MPTELQTDVSKQHIAQSPDICGGKPCIAGTRIRVQDIYVWHELQSQSVDEIVLVLGIEQDFDANPPLRALVFKNHGDANGRHTLEVSQQLLAFLDLF